MQPLTQETRQHMQNLAARYGISVDATTAMLQAVAAGGGTMAQFNIPELGGSGQWMQGGMTMVGDMFNHGLQATVSGLCSELAQWMLNQPLYEPPPVMPAPVQGQGQFQGQFQGGSVGYNTFGGYSWWPPELGQPSSSGGQNDSRYAYFPHCQRLAIEQAGQIWLYDTLDHQIGGVQQQQGGGGIGDLSFSSQRGTFTVQSLPLVQGPQHFQQGSQQDFQQSVQSQPMQAPPQPEPAPEPLIPAPGSPQIPNAGFGGGGDAESQLPQTQAEALDALERLGALHQRGILSDAEFAAKKAELLARI